MKYYEFYNPTKILTGEHAIDQIPYECMSFNISRPAIITDQTIMQLGHLDLIIKLLKDFDLKPQLIIDYVPTDSSVALVNRYAEKFIEKQCDGMIAVGGGSVIDTAKAVNIVASKNVNLLDVTGVNILTKKRTPLFAIPTTTGSGSEVTKIFVNSNRERLIKMEFVSDSIYPDLAIIDPRMITSMPKKLTATSAIDALVQSIEAFTCLQKNPISDAFSTASLKIFFDNIKKALVNDKRARLEMATSALMAGIALSNSMVGMIHAISHAIGSVSHVPHTDALATILIPCMKEQTKKLDDVYGELLLYVGGIDSYIHTNKEDRAKITISLIESLLLDLHEQAELPLHLSELGINKNDFETIAKIAINDGATITSPITVNEEIVLQVLNAAY